MKTNPPSNPVYYDPDRGGVYRTEKPSGEPDTDLLANGVFTQTRGTIVESFKFPCPIIAFRKGDQIITRQIIPAVERGEETETLRYERYDKAPDLLVVKVTTLPAGETFE